MKRKGLSSEKFRNQRVESKILHLMILDDDVHTEFFGHYEAYRSYLKVVLSDLELINRIASSEAGPLQVVLSLKLNRFILFFLCSLLFKNEK